MTGRERENDLWEFYRESVVRGDSHFLECEADFRVSEITEITPTMLKQLGVIHALIDLDKTLVCPPFKYIDPATLKHIKHVFGGLNIPLSIATENGAYPEDLAALIGEGVRVFQPYINKAKQAIHKPDPIFYRRILFEIDLIDTPERVVMIGDSPFYDIEPAQRVGMKTIQVDRLEKRINP
jgi:predicted HAD superfamily phosphohydrolase YqeG